MPTGLGDEQLWISATNDNTGSSTAFQDQSGNGNDGTASGATVIADTSEGGTYAFDFDGIDDYVICTLGTALGSNFSFACWIKFDTAAATAETFVSNDGYTSGGWLLQRRSNGNLRYAENGSASTFTDNVWSSSTSWHHVASVRSGGVLTEYIDGVLLPVSKTGLTGAMTSTAFSIGRRQDSLSQYSDCKMDDIRAYSRAITQAEITHLASSRGIEGRPTTLRTSLRANASYVTDTDLFSVCTPNTATSTNQTDEYTAAQGFGMIAGTYTSANFRDRSTSLATQLAGMTFQSTNGATFRMDLPDGIGEYKVWFAGIDAAAGQTTGWRFKDGTGGTEFATLDSATTTTQYVDINNTQQLASAFDIAGSNYIQRTFTNDHFTIVRDTALASGNGVISAVWVEKVGGTPPTTQYNAFTTHAFKQLFQTRLR